ncbi:MAG TPA: hypothetical protein DCL54_04260 [Alphaproteobacteria bacterium]|nr:hypothetical protein [Alphaproteobacteria bacterium]
MIVRPRLLLTTIVAAAFIALAAGTAVAQPKPDETEAAIRAALKAYRSGQRLEAKAEMERAAGLIDQSVTQRLPDFLPKPLDGWSIDEAEASSSALSASRSYSKGAQRVRISITGDMRVLTAMAFLIVDPAQAREAGAKLIQVKGNAALMTSDGQIQVLVANRFLVIAEGESSDGIKGAFLEQIDIQSLSKL